MTWGEWIYSDFNTEGIFAGGDGIYLFDREEDTDFG
jgi:hypothetical protein